MHTHKGVFQRRLLTKTTIYKIERQSQRLSREGRKTQNCGCFISNWKPDTLTHRCTNTKTYHTRDRLFVRILSDYLHKHQQNLTFSKMLAIIGHGTHTNNLHTVVICKK